MQKSLSFVAFILSTLVLSTYAFQDQNREKQIEGALYDLGVDELELREKATNKLIELEADKEVEVLLKETGDLEVRERGRIILKTIALNKELGKDLWQNYPGLVEELALNEKGYWPLRIAQLLKEKPDYLSEQDLKTLAQYLLNDKEQALELLHQCEDPLVWWLFAEAINSDDQEVRFYSKLWFVLDQSDGTYFLVADDKTLEAAVQCLFSKLENGQLKYDDGAHVLGALLNHIENKSKVTGQLLRKLIALQGNKVAKIRYQSILVFTYFYRLEKELVLELVESLLRRVEDNDIQVQEIAIRSLQNHISRHGYFGSKAAEKEKKLEEKAICVLLSIINDKEEAVRQAVVYALRVAVDFKNEKLFMETVDALFIKMFKDTPKVREEAIETFDLLGLHIKQEERERVFLALRDLLGDENIMIRWAAYETLTWLFSKVEIEEKKEEEVIRAILAFEEKGEKNPRSKPTSSGLCCVITIHGEGWISWVLDQVEDKSQKGVQLWRMMRDLSQEDRRKLKTEWNKGLIERATRVLQELQNHEKDYIREEAERVLKRLQERRIKLEKMPLFF